MPDGFWSNRPFFITGSERPYKIRHKIHDHITKIMCCCCVVSDDVATNSFLQYQLKKLMVSFNHGHSKWWNVAHISSWGSRDCSLTCCQNFDWCHSVKPYLTQWGQVIGTCRSELGHHWFEKWCIAGIILCMRPTNGRRLYNVTSLTDKAHTQNDPCIAISVPQHSLKQKLIVNWTLHWKISPIKNVLWMHQKMLSNFGLYCPRAMSS